MFIESATIPASVVWFVPWWRHLTYGGIHTIFRFISGFSARGLRTSIVIYDNAAADLLPAQRFSTAFVRGALSLVRTFARELRHEIP